MEQGMKRFHVGLVVVGPARHDGGTERRHGTKPLSRATHQTTAPPP